MDTELFTIDRGLWQNEDNPFQILLRRMASRSAPYFGFELKSWQPKELGVQLSLLLDSFEILGIVRFVLLKRRNLIRRIISSDLGHKTGQWHARRLKNTRAPTLNVKLSAPHFVSRIRAQERLWNETVEAFEGRPAIELTYEADVMNDPVAAYQRVCQFHRLRPFDDVQIRFTKMTPSELENIIENFDELAESLQGTGYEWMLGTD